MHNTETHDQEMAQILSGEGAPGSIKQILKSHGIEYKYNRSSGQRTMTKDGETVILSPAAREVYRKVLHTYGIDEPKLKAHA